MLILLYRQYRSLILLFISIKCLPLLDLIHTQTHISLPTHSVINHHTATPNKTAYPGTQMRTHMPSCQSQFPPFTFICSPIIYSCAKTQTPTETLPIEYSKLLFCIHANCIQTDLHAQINLRQLMCYLSPHSVWLMLPDPSRGAFF